VRIAKRAQIRQYLHPLNEPLVERGDVLSVTEKQGEIAINPSLEVIDLSRAHHRLLAARTSKSKLTMLGRRR